jgi:hypothetical protein
LAQANALARLEHRPVGDVRPPGAEPITALEQLAQAEVVFQDDTPGAWDGHNPPPAPVREWQPDDAFHLIITLILEDGRRYDVGGPVWVGSAPRPSPGRVAIQVDDPSGWVESEHVEFRLVTVGLVSVRDLNTQAGTEIIKASGEQIQCQPGAQYHLGQGDTVMLASYSIGIDSRYLTVTPPG